MYCKKCGLNNLENATFCSNCGKNLSTDFSEEVSEEKKFASMEELQKAAYSGDPYAQYLYGASLSFDINTFSNDDILLYNTWKEGANWLRKAADNGEVNALICLTRIYESNQDKGKLFMAYNELSDKFNNDYGQYKLGKMYEDKGDLSKAYYYYNRAAKNGNEKAIFLMKYHNPELFPIAEHHEKSYVIYGLLGIFIGCWGIHNFYAGQTKKGIIKIALTLTLIGSFVSSLWGLYEGLIAIIDKNIKD